MLALWSFYPASEKMPRRSRWEQSGREQPPRVLIATPDDHPHIEYHDTVRFKMFSIGQDQYPMEMGNTPDQKKGGEWRTDLPKVLRFSMDINSAFRGKRPLKAV